MKAIQLLFLTLPFLFYTTSSSASHITPASTASYQSSVSSPTHNLHDPSNRSNITPLTQNSKDVATEKTFNEELQWRILKLLVQQLFLTYQDSSNVPPKPNGLLENNVSYVTDTFSVNISALKTDFYLINIIDAQLGSRTELKIPKL